MLDAKSSNVFALQDPINLVTALNSIIMAELEEIMGCSILSKRVSILDFVP